MTTKIHMLCDTLGRPLGFLITPGQASDITAAPDLLKGQEAAAVLADKAYDSNDLRQHIADMKAEAVIPSKRNRKVAIPHDTDAYKHRNRIERCFNRLKHFRRFATRYDRRTIHFTGLEIRASKSYSAMFVGYGLTNGVDAVEVTAMVNP